MVGNNFQYLFNSIGYKCGLCVSSVKVSIAAAGRKKKNKKEEFGAVTSKTIYIRF